MKVGISYPMRRSALIAGTGLVVAYVRHGLATGWAAWEGIAQFAGYWLIHAVAVGAFGIFAAWPIMRARRFFLDGEVRDIHLEEVLVLICLTVLLGSIAVYIVAHWVPSGDNYDID